MASKSVKQSKKYVEIAPTANLNSANTNPPDYIALVQDQEHGDWYIGMGESEQYAVDEAIEAAPTALHHTLRVIKLS